MPAIVRCCPGHLWCTQAGLRGARQLIPVLSRTRRRATRALHFSGNSSVEGAINWLAEHEGDADLNEPLLVPKVRRALRCCLASCGCCGSALRPVAACRAVLVGGRTELA